MERIRKSLSAMPSWIFTIIVLMAILWLTLAPKPLGDEMPPLFPGADKIAHAIMFGGFSLVMLLDWQRKHGWKPVFARRVLVVALISSLLGAIIEVLQTCMGIGRGYEFGDIIADTVGAFLFAWFYLVWQKYWMKDK